MLGKVECFTYRQAEGVELARDKIAKLLLEGYKVIGVYGVNQEVQYKEHLERLTHSKNTDFKVIIDSDLDGKHNGGRGEIYTYFKILEKNISSIQLALQNTQDGLDTIL